MSWVKLINGAEKSQLDRHYRYKFLLYVAARQLTLPYCRSRFEPGLRPYLNISTIVWSLDRDQLAWVSSWCSDLDYLVEDHGPHPASADSARSKATLIVPPTCLGTILGSTCIRDRSRMPLSRSRRGMRLSQMSAFTFLLSNQTVPRRPPICCSLPAMDDHLGWEN